MATTTSVLPTDLEPDEIWDEYKSASITYGVPHPGSVVQGSSLCSVDGPRTEYPLQASLGPQIAEGKLSRLQLEGVAYACDRHRRFLPDGRRAGFIVGDSAGIGKGRQMAGIIMDNLRRGRKRHVWVSVSGDLVVDAERDLTDIGCAVHIVKSIQESKKAALPAECVLFCTYNELTFGWGKGKGPMPRYHELVEFLMHGGMTVATYSGVIVFDECHKAKNYTENPNTSTAAGDAVVKLQNDLPKARIVYSSATAITGVINMGYLNRMGLWGSGTNYEDFGAFKKVFGHKTNPMPMLEMIAVDFKTSGSQVVRNVGYKGAEFHTMNVRIRPDHVKMYDTLAALLHKTLKYVRIALSKGCWVPPKVVKKAGVEIEKQAPDPETLYWGLHQRFMRQLLTYFKVDDIVADVGRVLSGGYCAVIGLQGTSEAATKKVKETEGGKGKRVKVEAVNDDDDEDDYMDEDDQLLADMVFENKTRANEIVSACRVSYLSFLSSYFPVETQIDGTTLPECVAMRTELMADGNAVDMPPAVLDYLVDKLGGETRVAEMTGRKLRQEKIDGVYTIVDRARDPGVKRSHLNIEERKKFQAGTKLIAIISEAASTGVSLHAAKTAINQRRRIHYTLELPWAADQAIQQLGRTHRTNQVTAPIYQLVSTGIGGENRFVSSVARRLQSLGALTQGDKNASVGSKTFGDFQFESDSGSQAVGNIYASPVEKPTANSPAVLPVFWKQAWDEARPWIELTPSTLATEDFPLIRLDTDPYTEMQHVLKCAVTYLNGKTRAASYSGETSPVESGGVTRFLNRLLGMPVAYQAVVFQYFNLMLEDVIKTEKMAGTYERGVQAWTGCVVTRSPGTAPETIRTAQGGSVTMHTLRCDRGVDFETAVRELKYNVLVRFDATLKREDVPTTYAPAETKAEWESAYRLIKEAEGGVPDAEIYDINPHGQNRNSTHKTHVCFMQSKHKKEADRRVCLGIRIDNYSWKIIRPSTGFLDAAKEKVYDVNHKYNLMYRPEDFETVRKQWMEEYASSLTECFHGTKCSIPACTVGKRVFTSLLLTGSMVSCWGRLAGFTYVTDGDKAFKAMKMTIVQTMVDGKRITGVRWPYKQRSEFVRLVTEGGSASIPDEAVTPVGG